MTPLEIMISVVIGLAINETCDLSPWLARRIVRLAARLRYGDTARGRARAEDLAAYIETRPGKLLKLGAAVCFLAAGSAAIVCRRLWAIAKRISARSQDLDVRRTGPISPRRRGSTAFRVGLAIGAGIDGGFTMAAGLTSGLTSGAAVVVFALGTGTLALGIILGSSVISSVRTRRRARGRSPVA